MSKHNTFAIANGLIITADDGKPTLNSRIAATVDPNGTAVAEELVRRANAMPDLLAACKRLGFANTMPSSDDERITFVGKFYSVFDGENGIRRAIAAATGGVA